MLPAIPVMLKTAATSIAKQAAVDAASGALSSTAKNKLSKVTQPNSETRKLEHEFSKNFKELEEVNTSDGVLALQDSFNSKLESIVSTSDEQTSRLIDAVKDANKATAESINSNIENLREDITVLSRNVEAVNANIESVGQMTTLAAEASAQNIGTGSNFISDVVGSVKGIIQTVLGGALLSITGLFQSINRAINKTKSEKGGDKTGVSGLEIVGDEEAKTAKDNMDNAYEDLKAAERMSVTNSDAYAVQFSSNPNDYANKLALTTAFKSPEKALTMYNNSKPEGEKIAVSNNAEENFINLVRANKGLDKRDQGYVPFSKEILDADDETLKKYYSEYNQVGKEPTQEQYLTRKSDVLSKESDFKEATEESRQVNSEKIRAKVVELLSSNNKSGEAVIKELMTDENGNEVKYKFADVISYYATDKGMRSNKYNLSDETLNLYKELIPKLVEGLQNYITSESISRETEGRVTNNSPDDVYLKYVVGLGGDIKSFPIFGKTQNESDFNNLASLAYDGKVKLGIYDGDKPKFMSTEDYDFDTFDDALVKGVDKYDSIYALPANENVELTDEEKSILENYNGFSYNSYEELIAKLEEINQNVTSSAALNAEITLKSTEATSKAIENSGKNSQVFPTSNKNEMD